jgi:hypothetical protein
VRREACKLVLGHLPTDQIRANEDGGKASHKEQVEQGGHKQLTSKFPGIGAFRQTMLRGLEA